MISFILLFLLSFSAIQPKLRNLTTLQITKEMGIGINLGNTFDCWGDWIWEWGDHTPQSYETAWGSPVIEKGMIEGIKKEGFDSMRLPVHWFNMMKDFTINEEYMARVKQVVDWAIDAKLYVILNWHHDEHEFFSKYPFNIEETLENFQKVWAQIADAFQDYDDYLMFESLNEEACWNDIYNEWTGNETGKEMAFDLTYKLNQAFVDVIRSSGGNNPERHLLLAGYCTGLEYTCDPKFKLPKDPINRFALSIHYYNPATFCILSEDADWGKASPTWGTNEEIRELNKKMDIIQSTYIEKGIAVIIGEYGVAASNKEIESVRNYIYTVGKACYDRDILPVLWDTPGGYYNRTTFTMNDPVLKEMINTIKGLK